MSRTPAENFEVTRCPETGACVVRLLGTEYGSLDDRKLAGVLGALLDLTSAPAPPCLVLDVSNVQFFGARFVSVLVDTWDRLAKGGRPFALCGLTPWCAKLVRTLHLDKLFDIYPTPRAALEMMGRHGRGGEEPAKSTPARIRVSEVAWDSEMVRVEYVGEDDFSIRSEIRPRRAAGGAEP